MTNAEQLRSIMRNVKDPKNPDKKLTRVRIAELSDASIHSVNSWLLPPSNKAHRNMPKTKLRLLQLELAVSASSSSSDS